MPKSILIILLTSVFNLNLGAQTEKNIFSEEQHLFTKIENINIETKSGNYPLSKFYSQRPIILTLIFTRCTGICSPSILLLSENLMKSELKKDFKLVVLSFDPMDSLKNMNYFSDKLNLSENEQWIFGFTKDIPTLLKNVGFSPTWDSTQQQFDHDAFLVGINQNGLIVKKLIGLRDANAFNSLVKEIHNDFVPSHPLPGSKTMFSCFTYNPVTGKTSPSYGLLILLLPPTLTFLFLLGHSILKQKQKSRTNNI